MNISAGISGNLSLGKGNCLLGVGEDSGSNNFSVVNLA